MDISPPPPVVPIIASAPDAIPALPPAPPAPPPTAASVPTPTSAPAPPPLPTPSIPPPRLTSFSTIGYLNAKHVSSNFVKQDNQSFQARRRTDADWEREELAKRRRLVGEEGIEEAERKEEGGERVEIGNVLIKGEGKRVEPKAKAAVDNEDDSEDEDSARDDPLDRTIVIQPGSRFLRIGRASQAYPIKVPNAIARNIHNQPASPSTRDSHPPPFLRPLPAPPAPARRDALPPTGADATPHPAGSDDEAGPEGEDELDALSAKIQSIRGDFKARMRAFKLRGQGNGNSIAKAYNEAVVSEPLAAFNDDEGEIEWSATSGKEARETYVGEKAVRVANPAESGYSLRYPYDRGTFNEAGYTSQQELLGDIAQIWLDTLEEELEITPGELKNYSAILLIPDLYDHVYVREMADLILHTIGFRQLWLQQEAVCTTFGAGISTGCVVDVGAKKTSIACVEEGLVLAESRMALDFGGDDITQFLHTLLLRNGFPFAEADLSRWSDLKVLEELKEKVVVLGEKDVGMGLHEFWVRREGEKTKKLSVRVYDDAIMAPYALFAPRIIDFERKVRQPGTLWSKEIEDIVEIGGYTEPTTAMHNSTSHLLPAQPQVPLPALPSLPPLPFPDSALPSTEGTPAPQALALPPPGLAQPTAESSVAGSPSAAGAGPAAPAIDVRLESSKLPLDVAIVESILACGTEERMRKVCANVVIVGGTGAIHNIGFAVQSRVSPQLAYRVPSLAGQVEVVPAPREIEPDILAWKGIATLAKLDVAEDLWITREDWDRHGLRALRERAFYFA